MMHDFLEVLNFKWLFHEFNYLVAIHDEWQFFLGLHLHGGRRPLFVHDANVDP